MLNKKEVIVKSSYLFITSDSAEITQIYVCYYVFLASTEQGVCIPGQGVRETVRLCCGPTEPVPQCTGQSHCILIGH